MIKKLLNNVMAQKEADRQAVLLRGLIRSEARIGGQLFGPVPDGGRREFFCLDEHTWVWHEEWVDNRGMQQVKTTRYDVRPDGILKAQDGHYQSVTAQEAKHLRDAAALYRKRVQSELYPFTA